MATRSVTSVRQPDGQAARDAAAAATSRISSPLLATAVVLSRALSDVAAMCLLMQPSDRVR